MKESSGGMDFEYSSTIDGLSAETAYVFRIYSENRYGRSDFGVERINVKTLSEGNCYCFFKINTSSSVRGQSLVNNMLFSFCCIVECV